MFSNNGSAPNCMVMFAVDIKEEFLGIKVGNCQSKAMNLEATNYTDLSHKRQL
ncbi:hypothetical protein VHA01S_004_00120 [Vibrio halioticoli NBRC 102217]|uniref:Uncharacterized protein n=1 Tax=Vibrio halioticoli NBRC 102217 TaxID=1219072 RepID=V5FGQ6_9VIBR|nr:hypothetical protein VHA01S_004_00120 [Vibrio halioticoli NBRC 102217]